MLKHNIELVKKLEQKKEIVINKVEPKIRKTMNTIPSQFRDDVEQDVKLKMYKSFDNVDFNKIPGFFEFVEANNKRERNE